MNFSKIIGACSASKIESCNLIIAIDAQKAFDKTHHSPMHFTFFFSFFFFFLEGDLRK